MTLAWCLCCFEYCTEQSNGIRFTTLSLSFYPLSLSNHLFQLFAFLKYAGQKGVLGSSQLLPLAMARVGQFHEAVNWCFQHMALVRFNLLLEVGYAITEAEEPNDVILLSHSHRFYSPLLSSLSFSFLSRSPLPPLSPP
jgi:hypothetical protein